MENEILNVTRNCAPDLVKNTRININLDGWSASIAIISICVSSVAIYGMKTYGKKNITEEKNT